MAQVSKKVGQFACDVPCTHLGRNHSCTERTLTRTPGLSGVSQIRPLKDGDITICGMTKSK